MYMLTNTQLTKPITWQDSLSEERLKIIFRGPESTYMLSDLKKKKYASNIVGFIFLIAQNVSMARSLAGGS